MVPFASTKNLAPRRDGAVPLPLPTAVRAALDDALGTELCCAVGASDPLTVSHFASTVP